MKKWWIRLLIKLGMFFLDSGVKTAIKNGLTAEDLAKNKKVEEGLGVSAAISSATEAQARNEERNFGRT